MTAWFSAVPAFVAAAAILTLPGLLIGFALKLRGLWLWAAAGPISISAVVLSSLTLSLMGFAWAPAGVAAVTMVLAVIVWLCARVWFKQPSLRVAEATAIQVVASIRPAGIAFGLITAATLIVGGVIMFWRITQSIGDPGNISQTFDNIFHLNAVRFVLDTGDASPLKIGLMNSPSGNLGFYPSGWHALVSLVAMLSGASIAIATSATIAAVAAIVWIAGAMLLARTIFGSGLAVTLSAGALATGFAAFPILMTYYGVLYPMFLGFALVPLALAVVFGITRLERETLNLTLPTRWLLLLGLIPGITLAHPGAIMALLAFSVPVVLTWGWFALREAKSRLRVWIILVLFLIVGLVALLKIRPPREQAGWANVTSVADAAVDFVSSSLNQGLIPVAIAALVLVGVVVALVRHRRSDIALLGMYLVAAVLFIVAAGVPIWGIRFWVTGVWYQNVPRVEAMTVFAMLPLAVLGATWLIERLTSPLLRGAALRPLAAILTTVLAAAVFIGVQSSTQLQSVIVRSWKSYQYTGDSSLISTDELALLDRLDDTVEADATIVTNGWTGAGLAYAFAGRWVTMPHVMIDFTEDTTVLNNSLNSIYPGSEVCESVEAENAQYVLDFGTREVHGGHHDFAGLIDLAESPAFELVDQEGEAKLYRIIG